MGKNIFFSIKYPFWYPSRLVSFKKSFSKNTNFKQKISSAGDFWFAHLGRPTYRCRQTGKCVADRNHFLLKSLKVNGSHLLHRLWFFIRSFTAKQTVGPPRPFWRIWNLDDLGDHESGRLKYLISHVCKKSWICFSHQQFAQVFWIFFEIFLKIERVLSRLMIVFQMDGLLYISLSKKTKLKWQGSSSIMVLKLKVCFT